MDRRRSLPAATPRSELFFSFLVVLLKGQSGWTALKRQVAVGEVRIGIAAVASLFFADVPRQPPRRGCSGPLGAKRNLRGGVTALAAG
jgi:hypothetical protein